MTVFKHMQLQTHSGKLRIFFCLLAFLSFYHLHRPLSTILHPVAHAQLGVYGSLGPTSGQKHPIEILVQDARQQFTHMVNSQSKSLGEAIANYKKRYSREPPPGFDDWYHVAVRLNTTIIDNYDSVMATFEPYWGMSAREIRARVREALDPGNVGGKMLGIRVKDHQLLYLNEGTAINRMYCTHQTVLLRQK